MPWTILNGKDWIYLCEWMFSIMVRQVKTLLSSIAIVVIQVGRTDTVQAQTHIEYNGLTVRGQIGGIKIGPVGGRRHFP